MRLRLSVLFLVAILSLISGEQAQEAVVDAQGEVNSVVEDVPEIEVQPTKVDTAVLEAELQDLQSTLKLSKDGLEACQREMSELSQKLARCEDAKVRAETEAKEAMQAESSMRHTARAAQEQNAANEKELQGLKSALKDRNDEIVELKLQVTELKMSQAALQAKAEGMGTEEACKRCVNQGFVSLKERIGVLFKNALERIQAAISQVKVVVNHQVIPVVREKSQPIIAKASELYAEHAQAHVEQLKQQFDQHAGPYVQEAEQFYKDHVAEHVNEKSKLIVDASQKAVGGVSAGVAAHPLTEQLMGRKVAASEVSQMFYAFWLVLVTFLGMMVAWKVLKAVACAVTWPCRKLGLCGNNSRRERQHKRRH